MFCAVIIPVRYRIGRWKTKILLGFSIIKLINLLVWLKHLQVGENKQICNTKIKSKETQVELKPIGFFLLLRPSTDLVPVIVSFCVPFLYNNTIQYGVPREIRTQE